MKRSLVLLLALFSLTLYSQSITPENYYDYFHTDLKNLKGKKLSTGWLEKMEVATILNEEMKKAGFEWVSTFSIIKLGENQYVTAICYSEKSKVGFLYEGVHNAFPKVEDRNIKSSYKQMTGNDYGEKNIKLDGTYDYIKIKEVPANLFIIKQEPYWYQSTESIQDNSVMVSKEMAIEILRNDIKKVIAGFKK